VVRAHAHALRDAAHQAGLTDVRLREDGALVVRSVHWNSHPARVLSRLQHRKLARRCVIDGSGCRGCGAGAAYCHDAG
jgi:hypothetical protein